MWKEKLYLKVFNTVLRLSFYFPHKETTDIKGRLEFEASKCDEKDRLYAIIYMWDLKQENK